jgi:hypothetical protein
MLHFIFVSLLMIFPIVADTNPKKKDITASEILNMDLDRAFEVIAKMNKEEAKVLISSIRVEAKKDYENIEKFYLLISHLESIKAIEEEDKKLRDLNLVYGLGLSLIVLILLYTIYSQRKALTSIKQYTKE